jgi:uncharacterized membrane protein
MTLAPLADLPFAVHLHLWSALVALGLGPVAIYRRRRDIWHKSAGYVWVVAMVVVAASAFWIEGSILPVAGGFGAIHALSLVVLFSLWRGVGAVRAGDHAAHAVWMRSLYRQALILAGTFTLLPGRTLNQLLFPENPRLGVIAIALICLTLAIVRLRAGRLRRTVRG